MDIFVRLSQRRILRHLRFHGLEGNLDEDFGNDELSFYIYSPVSVILEKIQKAKKELSKPQLISLLDNKDYGYYSQIWFKCQVHL